MPGPSLNTVAVSPQADGSINITANVTPGAITIPTAKTFSLPALLKLIEDFSADIPTIIADVQAVFATAPTPTPVPTPAAVAPKPPIPRA